MLKGQMLEIGWIIRLFMVVALVFTMTIATQSTVSDTQLQNEESELLYRSQISSLHVMESTDKRNVLSDLENRLDESSEFQEFCKASIPGFKEEEPFFIQKTGSKGPECDINSVDFEKIPYLESNSDARFQNLVILWE